MSGKENALSPVHTVMNNPFNEIESASGQEE
jgi:hypothetical protein